MLFFCDRTAQEPFKHNFSLPQMQVFRLKPCSHAFHFWSSKKMFFMRCAKSPPAVSTAAAVASLHLSPRVRRPSSVLRGDLISTDRQQRSRKSSAPGLGFVFPLLLRSAGRFKRFLRQQFYFVKKLLLSSPWGPSGPPGLWRRPAGPPRSLPCLPDDEQVEGETKTKRTLACRLVRNVIA